MFVERWLFISCRFIVIIMYCIFKVYVVICLLLMFFIMFCLVWFLDGCYYNKLDIVEGIVVFICFFIVLIFYFKVF